MKTPHEDISNFRKKPSFTRQPYDALAELVTGRLMVFPSIAEVFVSGSCFRIARNLYVTSRHVIQDYLDRFGCDDGKAKWDCWIVHIEPGPQYAIGRLARAWFSPHSDLAILHTRPLNDIAAETGLLCVHLALAPPKIGDRITAFGFAGSSGRIAVDSNGICDIKISACSATAVGEVRKVHTLQRDSSRLKFPCFQINARCDGGMSGGPVFNDDGEVCGIVCSNLPPSSELEEHASYAATLWPLMAITIDVDPTGKPVRQDYPVLELARAGIVAADGWERVKIGSKAGTSTVTVTFS